ncbi:uncharacterized protein BDZ99DRAFT_520483 [Mytilinidion resinicola]|uniref:Nucleolar protein 12 n=1 Tax=Mytilinidion resinicola TaxID=574789 RepID=A0A6A6YPB0_9PEZI|nr:uncharacterized protein BDZ99DRAFT_520483 [Mytilinidion resinicola]KAF2810413.1 hypothetical protein BDZ99DRAFT_520483 [Mytilinidion resinicola]
MKPPAKRQKTVPVAEITFDFAAREEYLTGFHKRKLARAKNAQEEAAKKAKEEKVEARRMIRQQRKEDLERHVNEVNALLKKASADLNGGGEETDDDEDEDEWEGIAEELPPPIDREEEYIDEDKYTTVTVESVDISKSGFSKPEEDGGTQEGGDAASKEPNSKKRVWTKDNPHKDKPKKRKVKFRYETKSERKVTRFKERSKNRSQAKARRD